MLEARDITFGYAGAATLLYRGFSLQVEAGERVALSAPSGAGKTTLCRLLAGYERPWSGQVLVDGAPLPRRGACPVQMVGQHPELAVDPRMRMGAALREAGLQVGRLQEGTALGSSPRAGAAPAGADARAAEIMDQLGIRTEWLARFPHELSGGELQRFCIARALAANPCYLIADEVSTMLDAVTQASIWRVLLREAELRGMGLVFVSHSSALTARIATRVVSLPPSS